MILAWLGYNQPLALSLAAPVDKPTFIVSCPDVVGDRVARLSSSLFFSPSSLDSLVYGMASQDKNDINPLDDEAPGQPISVPDSGDTGESGKLKMIVQLVKKCLGVKDIAAMYVPIHNVPLSVPNDITGDCHCPRLCSNQFLISSIGTILIDRTSSQRELCPTSLRSRSRGDDICPVSMIRTIPSSVCWPSSGSPSPRISSSS